ncbi:MAG: masK12, partial [Myxococcaceae bacterium]|nr:masK12 [Myxococcaceae bacterium]
PKPGEAKPGEAKPGEAKVFTATITSDEPGVEITVDGKKYGKTPRVKIENLAFDKPHKVTARKDGFKLYTSDLENVDRLAEMDKYIELEREAKDAKPEPVAKEDKPKAEPKPKEDKPKAEPKPKPEPVAKEDKPKAEPKPKPEPVAKEEKPKPEPKPKAEPEPKPSAAKGKGKLACASKPAGAEVWVDGKNTGKKTPVAISSALELSAGKHKVIFKLNGKASAPQEITIDADQVFVLKGVEIPGA